MKNAEQVLMDVTDCGLDSIDDCLYELASNGDKSVIISAMKKYAKQSLRRLQTLYEQYDGSVTMAEIIKQVKSELK